MPERFPLRCLVFALLAACKNPPEAPAPLPPQALPLPTARLTFNGIEASGPDSLILRFTTRAGNPRDEGAAVTAGGGGLFLNGAALSGGFTVEAESFHIPPHSERETAVAYRLDMKALCPPEAAALEVERVVIEAKSVLSLGFVFDGGLSVSAFPEAVFTFPRVREPRFSIVSIAVMQAELINTRFRVKVRIDNPNPFPLTLSAFRYELYSSGRLWAAGMKKTPRGIPENGAAEETLFVVMNFIDMRRDILDQVIAMRDIHYRFTGAAEIGTGITYLPVFTAGFDLDGYSEVIQ